MTRARLALLFSVLFLLTGCWTAINGRTRYEADGRKTPPLDVPARGSAMTPERWQSLDALEGQKKYETNSVVWLVFPASGREPSRREAVYSYKHASIYPPLFVLGIFGAARTHDDAAGKVDSLSTERLGFQTLPLFTRFSFGFHDYDRADADGLPARSAWAEFNPYWTTGHNSPDSDLQVQTRTIPLLYSDLIVQTKPATQGVEYWPPMPEFLRDARAHTTMTLLGLGPFSFRARAGGLEFSWFEPLFLGRLGAALWMDFRARSARQQIDFHGPLLLGYYRSLDKRKGDEVRLLTWGALWYESIDWSDYEAGQKSYARKGPLWGMFGWGTRKSRPVFYFLYLPIPNPLG